MKKILSLMLIVLLLGFVIPSTITNANSLDSTPSQIYVSVKRSFSMDQPVPNSIGITRIVNNAVYQGHIQRLTYSYNPSTDRMDAYYAGFIQRQGVTPSALKEGVTF